MTASNRTFAADAAGLRHAGYDVDTLTEHRGFVSAVVRRTGAFNLPQSEDDWAHTREHRGALGGVIAPHAIVR